MEPLVGIFAHPDDEAFGPGGTLALEAKKRDVYLICVTNGEAGKSSLDEVRELGEVRREELLESAKILGIKKVFFLGYHDGTLSNTLYHEIAEKIIRILNDIKPNTLLTFEPRGVSGHIDHIAVSMITSFVFYKVSYVKHLWQYCLTEKARNVEEYDYFIYFPPGYKKSEIVKIRDVSPIWKQKVKAIHAHKSQLHDIEQILKRHAKLPKEECFLEINKSKE